MRTRLFVRSTAALAAVCLSTMGIASSAWADDGESEKEVSVEVVVETPAPEPIVPAPAPEPIVPAPAPEPIVPAPAPEPIADPLPEPAADDAIETSIEPAPVIPGEEVVAPAEDGNASVPDVPTEQTADPADVSASDAQDPAPAPEPVVDPEPATAEEIAGAIEEVAGNTPVAELTEDQVVAIAAAICGTDEICVDASGQVANAFADIQAAIDAATSGQVIRVFSGTYDPFAVTTAVQILAADGADVVITVSQATGVVGIRVMADDVTIQGLTLQCMGGDDYYTFGIDVGFGTPPLTNNFRADGMTFENCSKGIVLSNTENAVVTTSTFFGGDTGVDVVNANNATIDNSLFQNMVIGVGLQNVSNSTVSNSTFVEATYSVAASGADNLVVSDSYFEAAREGVSIFQSNGVEVTGNHFTDGYVGASLWHSSNLWFANNTANNMAMGVEVVGSSNVTISNNAFLNSWGGVAVARGVTAEADGQPIWYPSSNISILNNYFENIEDFAIQFTEDSFTGTALVSGNSFVNAPNAIYVDENAGGIVDARDGNYFGECGPNAVSQGVNLGGAIAEGSSNVLLLDLKSTCEEPAPTAPNKEGKSGQGPAAAPVAATPVAAATPVLASTGVDSMTGALMAAGSMLLVGAGLVLAAARRRHV